MIKIMAASIKELKEDKIGIRLHEVSLNNVVSHKNIFTDRAAISKNHSRQGNAQVKSIDSNFWLNVIAVHIRKLLLYLAKPKYRREKQNPIIIMPDHPHPSLQSQKINLIQSRLPIISTQLSERSGSSP